jgi:GNAT superfamily N-acetyltransferase
VLDFEERLPTPGEHRTLAESVGWDDHFDWDSAAASVANSLHGVVAIDAGTAVGMGRVVGDGVHYFYLQDVIVRPDYSDQGIGAVMVERLLDWIARTVPAPAFVGLFASDEAVRVYRKQGFGTADMTGMHRVVEPRRSQPDAL